jgi:thiol:disulfide interchange protein DsbA
MVKKFLVLSLFILLPAIALAASAPQIKGQYTTVPGKEFKYDGKTVEVLEFLSFYCGTCYEFEKSIPAIKGNFPKKIKWKLVPVYWGEGSSKPGEAYLLAEEAGKGEAMKKAIFKAHFVDKKDIGSVEVLESLAAQAGLGFDFSRKLRNGAKAAEAAKALDMAREYRIEETPTLIIGGNIATNPHASGHDMNDFKNNIMSIIGSIVKK